MNKARTNGGELLNGNDRMVKKGVLRTCNRLQGNKLEQIIRCYRSPEVHAVLVFRFGKCLKKKGIFVRILLEPTLSHP
jgi:hypothetical protein